MDRGAVRGSGERDVKPQLRPVALDLAKVEGPRMGPDDALARP